jgi:hypothetical protein
MCALPLNNYVFNPRWCKVVPFSNQSKHKVTSRVRCP